jgi:hypothetical protein
MTVPELVAKYRELYGEPTRSHNRDYLRKRLSWRVQELAGGGVTASTLELISNLSDAIPEAWRQRVRALEPKPKNKVSTRACPRVEALCHLHAQVDVRRARAGVQLARRAARGLCGLHRKSAWVDGRPRPLR